MGPGVAGALRRRAGEQLNEEAVSKGPVELGEVAVTDAYGLDAESLADVQFIAYSEEEYQTVCSVVSDVTGEDCSLVAAH